MPRDFHDLIAEGGGYIGDPFPTARMAYKALIEDIHGPGFWSSNPWLIVTRFTPELRNIDAPKEPA